MEMTVQHEQPLATQNNQERPNRSRQPINLMALVPWMLSFSFLSMMLTLFLVSGIVQDEAAKLESDLTTAEAMLSATPVIDPEEAALNEQMLTLQSQVNAISAAVASQTANHVNWPHLMAMLNNYDHTQMVISGLIVNEQRLTLSGKSSEEQHVIFYTELLDQSGLFHRVTISSIGLSQAQANADMPETMPVNFSILVEMGENDDA